jgi:hypothetical protein
MSSRMNGCFGGGTFYVTRGELHVLAKSELAPITSRATRVDNMLDL